MALTLALAAGTIQSMDVFLAALEEILTRRLEVEVREWWATLPADWRDLLQPFAEELLATRAVSVEHSSTSTWSGGTPEPEADKTSASTLMSRKAPRCPARKKSPEAPQCRNHGHVGLLCGPATVSATARLCHVHQAQQRAGTPFERMDDPLREGQMTSIGRAITAEWGEVTAKALVQTEAYAPCQRVDIGGEILLMMKGDECDHLYRFDRSYRYVGMLWHNQLFVMKE